jgi:predicted ABC-type exoprotein transport system permease subunit
LSSEGAAAETAEPTEANKWPSWWVLGLQLAALWSLGLVRPLFDVLGTDEAFFVARGNTPGDILIFAIGLTFVPPLVLTIVELIVGAVSTRAARIVHLVFVALLAALLALQFVKGAITVGDRRARRLGFLEDASGSQLPDNHHACIVHLPSTVYLCLAGYRRDHA